MNFKEKIKLIKLLEEKLDIKTKDYVRELTLEIPGRGDFIATDIVGFETLIHHSWDEHPHSGSPMDERRYEALFTESNADEAIMYLKRKVAERAKDEYEAKRREEQEKREIRAWCIEHDVNSYTVFKY